MSMAGPRSLAESELQALWNDAESEFERLTTKKLRFHGPPKTFDDIIKEIENRKIDDDSSEGKGKREKMKKISQKVLNSVQLLAGIVAQGASTLYPPAGLCFNAVSYLVAIPGKVSKIYGAIGELLDRISVCLSQFKIYKRIEQYRRIDPALLSTIHKILASLVKICALSIKLLDGGTMEKIRQTFKVALFDEDPGTSAELRKLSLLAESQSAIAGSLTLESVLMNESKLTELLTNFRGLEPKVDSIRDSVSQLIASEKARNKKEILNGQLQKIAKKLVLPVTVKEETLNIQLEKIQNEKIGERLPGTGKWLDAVSEYTIWEDRDSSTATSVLLLIGEESFGKSILTSAIISKLQARYGQGERASTRTYVAFYYFQKGSEKTEQGQKVLTVEYALKCMSYQLAYDDEVYRKDMESLCNSNAFDIDSADFVNLWKYLKLGTSKTDVTYFLIFDGIDQVEKKNAKRLLQILSALENSEEMGQLRLRIMLTGRKAAFEDESFEMASTISLGDYNKPDIEKYISQELDKTEVLQGDDVERMDLRSNIKAKLPQKVGGDFSKVQTAFDAFKQAKFIEEVSKILDGKDLDRKTYLKMEIKKYNKKLSSDDVEDLNELLAWVVYGLEVLSVAQLEAALLLRHDKASLQPLESKLKKEYSIFFTIENDGGVINKPECTELVTEEKENDDDEEDKPDMTSKQEADTQITAAEIKMVDRFILQICGKEIYDRFGFPQFFERKGSHPAMIGMRKTQAHLIIVKNCLKLLTSDEDKRTKPLASYAITNLPEHLSCAAKVKNIGSADKNFVQTKLLMLLTHESVIERCWQSSTDISYFWIDSQAMENIWQWMRDSVEVRNVYAAKDDWFRTAPWSEEPGIRLLKPIVRMMAKRWLQSRDFPIEETMRWVIEYVKKTFDKAPTDSESDDESVSISAAISWAQKELDVKEANSLWYERSGEAYFAGAQYTLAIKSFRQAKSMDPSNWKVDEMLALTFAEYDDYADHYLAATQAMEIVLEVFRNNSDLGEEYPGRFVQNLQHQAAWQRELKNSEEAIKLYQEALRADEGAYKCVYGILSILQSQDKIEEAQELLIGMDRKPTDEHGSTQLVAMHHVLALDDDNDEYFTTTFEIAKKGQIFERFRNTVQSAIDVAKRKKHEHLQGVLLFYLGSAFAGEEQRRSDAVKRWQDCVTLALKPSLRDWNLAEAGYKAFHRLSSYYYKNALKTKLEGGDPAIYLDRLDKLTESASAEETSYMTWIPGFQESRLLLGRYYALTESVEKARVYFKKEMQSGLDLLSDEDPSNDWMGYLKLAETLMHFGDDLNALSAWSLLIPDDLKASPVDAGKVNKPKQEGIDKKEDEDRKSEDNCMKSSDERSKAEEAQRDATVVAKHDNGISETEGSGEEKHAEASEEAESDVKSEEVALKEENPENYPVVAELKIEIPPTTVRVRSGDLRHYCDGRCNTRWHYADDMYCCKYCPDVQFDKACLDKLRAGTLNLHICGADHEFLHVPKWSDEVFREVGFGNVRVGGEMVDEVRVGGEVVEIEEWLDRLREEWGVSKPMKVETSIEV